MKETMVVACVIVLSVMGCKKQPNPTLTPVANPPKESPYIPGSTVTTRESASGAAATTPPVTTQPLDRGH